MVWQGFASESGLKKLLPGGAAFARFARPPEQTGDNLEP
jgi:hypothetical protein